MQNDISITVLREFCEAAQTLNFTKAAKRLHMSQPTLSKHLGALEKVVGAQLFDRTGTPVRLTNMGKLLLSEAQDIIDVYDKAFERIGSAAQQGQCAVVIDGNMHHALSLLASHLSQPCDGAGPAFKIDFYPSRFHSIKALVDANGADLYAVFDPSYLDPSRFEITPLFTDTLSAVLPPGHRLASRQGIRLASLEGEPFLITTGMASYDNRSYAQKLFEHEGVRPRYAVRAIETVYDFVPLLDEFVYFDPTFTVPYYELLKNGLFPCKLVCDDSCRVTLHIGYRKDSPKAALLADIVAQIKAKQLPPGLIPCP